MNQSHVSVTAEMSRAIVVHAQIADEYRVRTNVPERHTSTHTLDREKPKAENLRLGFCETAQRQNSTLKEHASDSKSNILRLCLVSSVAVEQSHGNYTMFLRLNGKATHRLGALLRWCFL